MTQSPTCILGLDPGLRHTGWGIIEVHGHKLRHIAHGTISPPSTLEFSKRLAYLFSHILDICQTYKPHTAAIESVFVNSNSASTLKLSAARGAVMVAPAHYGIEVAEYAANRIKKTTVGQGHAGKTQMQDMIPYLLPKCGPLTPDSADALAVAICHSHYGLTLKAFERKIA